LVSGLRSILHEDVQGIVSLHYGFPLHGAVFGQAKLNNCLGGNDSTIKVNQSILDERRDFVACSNRKGFVLN
jgi:hypothetical protein